MLVLMTVMVCSPETASRAANHCRLAVSKPAQPGQVMPMSSVEQSPCQKQKSPGQARAGGFRLQSRRNVGCLLEQRQHRLWLLVGLGQHGGGRLLNDLATSQFGGGLRVICIPNAAAGGRCIGRYIRQVVGRVGEAVHGGTHFGATAVHCSNCSVQSSDCRIRVCLCINGTFPDSTQKTCLARADRKRVRSISSRGGCKSQ